MPKKLNIEDCNDVAESRGGKCLSKIYKNNRSRMLWRCKYGHEWYSKFAHMKSGHWCGKCATKINAEKSKLSDGLRQAIEIANSKNGKCISGRYDLAHSHMKWQCEFGHIWHASLSNIKRGYWCPVCAGQIVCLDDCVYYASLRKGKCLSDKYINCRTDMEWECELGHKWKTAYMNIRSGKWCPVCSSGKTQKLLFDIINDIFPEYSVEFNYRGFEWLKMKTNKQEIDIFVKDIKLAIEYDGHQHFVPVRFGGISQERANKNLQRVMVLDKIKEDKILNHNDDVSFFVRFSYKEPISIRYVRQKLMDYGIDL